MSVTNSSRKTWKDTHPGGIGCHLNSLWAKCWLKVGWGCSKETLPCYLVQVEDISWVICKETQWLQRSSLAEGGQEWALTQALLTSAQYRALKSCQQYNTDAFKKFTLFWGEGDGFDQKQKTAETCELGLENQKVTKEGGGPPAGGDPCLLPGPVLPGCSKQVKRR